MFEYACNEGNYGMFGILSGREPKRTAAAKVNERRELSNGYWRVAKRRSNDADHPIEPSLYVEGQKLS